MLDRADLPATLADEAALDALLARPSAALVRDMAAVEGDLLVLGASGKMGPSLARLARAASTRRVIAVARFTDPASRRSLDADGIETIACDLLDRAALARLPDAANVVFMAGHKFGSSGDPALTWAMNVHMAALVAERYAASRIVAFSTGCVYPFAAADGRGCDEAVPPDPPGEYAMSCLGRERMFEHFSQRAGTPGRLVRLNYAIDLRYGVLHDIARAVRDATPIDVAMGAVNVIWQGDACAQALRSLRHCTTPTTPLNVTGPERLAVRDLAAGLGRRMGRTPVIVGREAATCWLNDAAQATRLFGEPVVPVETMLDWVADWVAHDRPSLNKPTKFEVRSGVY